MLAISRLVSGSTSAGRSSVGSSVDARPFTHGGWRSGGGSCSAAASSIFIEDSSASKRPCSALVSAFNAAGSPRASRIAQLSARCEREASAYSVMHLSVAAGWCRASFSRAARASLCVIHSTSKGRDCDAGMRLISALNFRLLSRLGPLRSTSSSSFDAPSWAAVCGGLASSALPVPGDCSDRRMGFLFAAQAASSTIRASNPVAAPGGGEDSSSRAPCFSTMVLTIESPSP
jgi:hypothetical protein